MTGQELYALWQRKLLELQGVAVEEWDELPEGDQEVWEATATELHGIFAEEGM